MPSCGRTQPYLEQLLEIIELTVDVSAYLHAGWTGCVSQGKRAMMHTLA